MSEMVERVAKALVAWQQLPESAWVDHLDMARAAIEAMREPTYEMVLLTEGSERMDIVSGDICRIWQNMIDQALK